VPTREVVKIDEEKCNGCGVCIPSCKEGALELVDEKARLVSDAYCDGLGACLNECPQGAITIESREADAFDEEAVAQRMASPEEETPCDCPGAAARSLGPKTEADAAGCCDAPAARSELTHWPVQLTLVPPRAPFLKDADVLLAAHCVPFAMGDFHQRLLRGRAVVTACPKLDDTAAHLAKLTAILKQSGLRSLTVAHMEVPCCHGLQKLAEQAAEDAGTGIAVGEIVVPIGGA